MSAEPLRVSCCLGADSGTVVLSNIIIKQNKLMSENLADQDYKNRAVN